MRRPLAEVSANIAPFDPTADYVLDTPAPKRPRLKTPEELAPLTAATLPTNAFSLPTQIPPPSNGPRRSSRVSAIPKVDYFNVLADIDGESEPVLMMSTHSITWKRTKWKTAVHQQPQQLPPAVPNISPLLMRMGIFGSDLNQWHHRYTSNGRPEERLSNES